MPIPMSRQLESQMIVLLTKDLFFVPTLRSAATKQGVEIVVALSHESEKLTVLSSEDVSAWIIDLNSVPIAELPGVVNSLQGRFPQAKRIAFGPHVQAQRLQAAQAAGCEQVLSRGQFDSQLDRLLPEWI